MFSKRCSSIVLVAIGSLVTACGLVSSEGSGGGADGRRGEAPGSAATTDVRAGAPGATVWTQSVTDVDPGFAIHSLTAVPGGGAAFTGAISPNGGRPLIERVDDQGARVWRRTVESGSVAPQSVVADATGAVTIGGSYRGAVDFGGASLSDWGAFAAQLDGTGTTRWVWADPHRELGVGIVADGDDGVLLTRHQIPASKLDANGQLVWSRVWDGAPEVVSLTRGTSGAYALAGLRGSSSTIPLDLGAGPIPKRDTDTNFLAFYGADGTYRWDLRIGVTYSPSINGWEGITRVAIDAQDNVWVAGMLSSSIALGDHVLVSAGGADVFVAKLDSSGHVLLARVFGGWGDERLEDLAIDSTGRIVITGSFAEALSLDGITLKRADGEPSASKGTLFVAKLETNGKIAWARSSLDDRDCESGELLAVDPMTNAIWLAGIRRFGESLKSRWFLAKLAP